SPPRADVHGARGGESQGGVAAHADNGGLVESAVADAPYVVRPINDQVMIRRTPDRQVGRILIPDSADTKPRIGIVEAVGPGRLLKSGKHTPISITIKNHI